LLEGQLLRSASIYTTEQNLFATDAFEKVTIQTRDVGTTDKAERKVAVEIDVVEQPPRLATYGGGYSTDVGASGFFDIRHVNLFGNLWQGGARVRVSQRQQLVQFDFINPRFVRDGKDRFAPLTISAQYQRDTTVTRFFRSAFDKGTFGIVQRIDADGNPIDDFGRPAGSPTIDRITLTAETSRTINRKERSLIFARFRYEDVRLQNVESLLVKELLQPDARVRISGFGLTYVRDTRENCSRTYTLLELIATGEIGNECRYNASDPTKGSYLTADYNFSLPQLGANIGFHKFQANYRFFYSLPRFRNLTFAGQAILGLAQVFSAGDRFPNANLADLNGILPISERFYAGGSNNLRGFDFDEAGPRVVVVPQGTFRNTSGEQVFLDPFTIPFGGNAMAIVNLEARLPLTKSIRVVPFYDGGNVFRRIGDIFNPPDVPANDVLRQNLRALWTHTVGVGLRLKTPVGGEFAVDYGYLLNPSRFLIPQTNGTNAIYQLKQGQLHFRFSQAF
jgi:outer membrane protein assembly factor BamA